MLEAFLKTDLALNAIVPQSPIWGGSDNALDRLGFELREDLQRVSLEDRRVLEVERLGRSDFAAGLHMGSLDPVIMPPVASGSRKKFQKIKGNKYSLASLSE